MAIQITLEDHTGNVSHQAKMDENAQVGQLIPAIITSLRLPISEIFDKIISSAISHKA